VLDVRRLRILREVARTGSVSGAARALDYTQPAVSHHLARLEAEVGTPLLVRAGRGVRLTEAGTALVAHADVLLARLADAEEEVAAIAGLHAGRVRAASFPSGSATLVPAALVALRERHPGIDASFVEAEPPGSIELLAAGDVDLALAFAYDESSVPPPSGHEVVELLADDVLAVLPAGHARAGNGTLDLAVLAGETWIAGCPRCRGHLLHACAGAGFAPRIAHETDDYVTVQALVAAGLGVALLPGLALRALRRDDVAVLALAVPAPRHVVAVVPAPPRPPATDALLDALRAAAAHP
jgi:molybdate transport repressor ModE-like protein